MSFFSEIRRRGVLRVAVAYAAVSWLIIQVVATVFPLLDLPERWASLTTIFLIVGFPFALILSWVLQITPTGIVVDDDAAVRPETAPAADRRFNTVVIVALSLALVFVIVDQYVIEEDAFLPDGGRSVAVLPFRSQSLVPDDVFFADGIHDGILARLTRFSSFDKVISRTSAEQFRGSALPVSHIAETLGVNSVLEGSVQRAGNRVRVIVNLVGAERDENLWAGTFERELSAGSIFAIQTEISLAVANALDAVLSNAEQADTGSMATASLEALEQYFLGKERMYRRTGESLAKALTYFERAAEIDPGFALAYVGIADTLLLQRLHAGAGWEDVMPQASSRIDTAMAIDDRLPEAYTALGNLHIMTDYELAAASFQRAIELAPNDVGPYLGLCDLEISYLGRPAIGLEYCERAVELDPLSREAMHMLGFAYSGAGKFGDAERTFLDVVEMDPANSMIYAELGWLYSFSAGRPDEAIKWFTRSIDRNPAHAVAMAWLAFTYLDLGDADSAADWSSRALEQGPNLNDALYAKAMLEIYRDNPAEADDYIDRAYQSGPTRGYPLALVKDRYLERGQLAEAVALYESHYPELLDGADIDIHSRNMRVAIDLAQILQLSGDRDRATELLDAAEAYVQSVPRLSAYNGTDVADVQIATLRGDHELALDLLGQAQRVGFVSGWWYFLKVDSLLEPIRDTPEFASIVLQYERSTAELLERVREWQATAEAGGQAN